MINKFNVAFQGLVSSFQDKSVQIQYILAILACIVIVAEILNTCIEKLCDLYTTERNEKIKFIKDLGAGSVLFASMIALSVGILIFIHHLF